MRTQRGKLQHSAPGTLPTLRLTKARMNLYDDGVHPNIAGSYLVACSVFSTIYGKPAPAT